MSQEEAMCIVCARFASWIYGDTIDPEDARVSKIVNYVQNTYKHSEEFYDSESYNIYVSMSMFFGLMPDGLQRLTYEIAQYLNATRDEVLRWINIGLSQLADILCVSAMPSLDSVLSY